MAGRSLTTRMLKASCLSIATLFLSIYLDVPYYAQIQIDETLLIF